MLDDLSERARDHFRTPRNAGAFACPDAAATVQNDACGDVLKLSLAFDGGRIREARFKTFGCAASIAAGSVLVFIPTVGAFITPDLLGGGKVDYIGNVVERQFKTARDWPFGSALSFLLMGIVLVATVIYFRTLQEEQEENE